MPSTQNAVTTMNIVAFLSPRLRSLPPIPASDLMPKASKNSPPASRRKRFWPLFWCANWMKASTRLSPGHVASERRNWRNSKNFPFA
jgi:hypothetical protein